MRTILAERPVGSLPVLRRGSVGRIQHASIFASGIQGHGCERRVIQDGPAISGIP